MSVKVNKFKLEGRGYQGVKVSGTETRQKDGMAVVVDIDMNFKIPLPTEIFSTVQRLKKYMLDLCGYWHPSFEEFIKQGRMVDQSFEGDKLKMYQHLTQLMDSAEVTGIVSKEAFLIITGKVTNVVGGVVGLSTPLTGPSSGYDRWDFVNRGCRQCLEEVQNFVNEKRLRLMEARQYALEFADNDPEKIDQYSSMNDDELLQLQVKNLEDRGAIVLLPDDFGQDQGEMITEKVIHTSPVESPADEIGQDKMPVINVPDEPIGEEDETADIQVKMIVEDLPQDQ